MNVHLRMRSHAHESVEWVDAARACDHATQSAVRAAGTALITRNALGALVVNSVVTTGASYVRADSSTVVPHPHAQFCALQPGGVRIAIPRSTYA